MAEKGDAMKSNNAELLINITRKAPWLMGEDKTFFPESVQGNVQRTLDSIKDYNLTIITDTGRAFKQYLILRIQGDKVVIDTPFEWDDSVTSFHVFFRDKDNRLYFFQVSGAESNQTTISAGIPDTISVLQKRRFKRAMTPVGTKVLFRNDNNLIDSAFVHDISEGGMLIWTGDPKAPYHANSTLSEIFISLPAGETKGEAETFHRVLPYVTKGKIVRVNTDQFSSISHYGVSFIHDDILLNKRFNALIVQLKDQISAGGSSENCLNFANDRRQNSLPSAQVAKSSIF